MEKAVALDPTSPNYLADLGQTHYFRREYDEARQYCQKALAIDPDFIFAHSYLENIALITGDLDLAVNEWKATAIATQTFPNMSDQQRRELVERHSVLEARYRNGTPADLARELIAKDIKSAAVAYGNARLYALLGEKESALDFL